MSMCCKIGRAKRYTCQNVNGDKNVSCPNNRCRNNPKPNLKLNAGLIYNDFDDDSLVSIKMTMQKFFIYEEIDMKNEEQF